MNGAVWDLDRPLEQDTTLAILTDRDPDALALLRHSSAHILATAVRELFPGAGIGFGPPIEDGFYYDFEVDAAVHARGPRADRGKMARGGGRELSVRARGGGPRRRPTGASPTIRSSSSASASSATDETISTYTDGPFIDLCRGPHVPRTGRLKHFKLLHRAGAYWRGDERRQMLQRIYGTAFFKKEDLDAYLHRLEEARKRDHRRLGRELDLFMFHPSAPGAPFWTERGTTLYNLLVDFVRERQRQRLPGDQDAAAVQQDAVGDLGHWGKYRENMFLVLDNETGEHDFVAQADELPVALSALRHEEAFVPRAAPALRHLRRAASERSDRRAVAGSRGCASSPRTTATSS